MDHLVIDIVTNILSRLPVRSVFRFRSVCKTWCSAIDDPLFINMMHSPLAFIFLPDPYEGDGFYIAEDNSNGHVVKSPKINLTFPHTLPLFLVGSSHGLLCLSSYDVREKPTQSICSTYVCNPSTQDYVMVPNLNLPLSEFHHRGASGFGFAISAKEFKVVQLFHFVDSMGRRCQWEVHVYTLGSEAWRKVGDHDLNMFLRGHDSDTKWFFSGGGSRAFLNGSIHWILASVDNANGAFKYRILSFDLENEILGVVPNADFGFLTNYQDTVRLGVLGGCLCLTNWYSNDVCEIWVMEEYNVMKSWTKKFVIRKHITDDMYIDVIHPICFWRNGELVLLCDSKFLVSYNLASGKITLLEDDDFPKFNYEYQKFIYVGSSLSPPKPRNRI